MKKSGLLLLWLTRIYGALISLFFGGIFLIIMIGTLFPDSNEESLMLTAGEIVLEITIPLIFLVLAIGTFIYTIWKKNHFHGGIWIISWAGGLFTSILLAKIILYPGLERLDGGLRGGLMYGIPFLILGILFIIVGRLEISSNPNSSSLN